MSGDSPVFIVGCGHSGTTLLISILHAHSDLYAVPGETDILHPSKSRGAVRAWYEAQREAAGPDRRIVEKTPANIRFLARAFRLFPECRVVIVTRDGRDVACSLRKRTGRLPGAVARWLYDTAQGLAWEGDPRILSIRYEDMVTDFERTLAEVCAFLGLEVQAGLQSFYDAGYDNRGSKGDSEVTTHSRRRTEQTRSPIYDGRGTWKGCFSPLEQCMVMAVSEKRLKQLGYIPG